MSAEAAALAGLLRQSRDRIAALEAQLDRAREPAAILGLGCRFPGGADSPPAFWDLLLSCTDATADITGERWDHAALLDPRPGMPGHTVARRGAFLDGIDAFDPAPFGLTPHEAATMDPQQRLLLEVTHDALENAGIAPDGLSGSRTGVYLGTCWDDFARLSGGDLSRIDGGHALGGARSVAAGRIAYVFGLQGPVVQIDTSCSSSLVALHYALRDLRSGDCDLALVAGVNVMLSPEAFVAFSQLGALSPDGRCRAFGAGAGGFGRGEGCGVVVLRRLSDAMRDGSPVAAVLRGSAVNHDGRSNGLTAPNGRAQEQVIRAALADAGVPAASVGYVEAHGTGTALGDPIELNALERTYGASRKGTEPLPVGSVKSNIGHLEAAAGVAALVKTVLALRHGSIPASLHASPPNPHVDWARAHLAVPAAPRDWPAASPRRAGVSAFGMSGTNVHAILEEPPPRPALPAPAAGPDLFCLSAQSPAALAALTAATALRIKGAGHAEFAAACRLSRLGRAQYGWRRAFVARDSDALAGALHEIAAEKDPAPPPPPRPPRVALHYADASAVNAATGSRLFERSATAPDGALTFPAIERQRAAAGLLAALGLLPARVFASGSGHIAAAGTGAEPADWPVEGPSLADCDLVVSLGRAPKGIGHPHVHACLVPGQDTDQGLLTVLASLFDRGLTCRFAALDGHGAPDGAALPTYRFDRRRFALPRWLASGTADPRTAPPESVSAFLRRELSAHSGRAEATLGPDLRLDALGLDSLALAELHGAILDRTGHDIPLARIPHLTLGALETLLAGQNHADGPRHGVPSEDHLADAALPLPARGLLARPQRGRRTVLLTGATGFLGAFLLDRLIARGDAEILCLVRAASASEGRLRIGSNLRKLHLLRAAESDRWSAIPGDLDLPGLGLTPAEHDDLLSRVTAILSSGAQVSYVAGYADLRRSHVEGTRALLALAMAGAETRVHHVSSIAVFEGDAYRGLTLPETAVPEAGAGITLPYSQAKWASEALLRRAGSAGLPITVHRPSLICGSAADGTWNDHDLLFRMLGTFLARPGFPDDLDILLDFSPVDYVAEAIVALSADGAMDGRAFHLGHPQPVPWARFRGLLEALGVALEPMPYARWLAGLRRDPTPQIAPLMPFLATPAQSDGMTWMERAQAGVRPRLTTTATEAQLLPQGITCPPIDETLLRRLIRHTGTSR